MEKRRKMQPQKLLRTKWLATGALILAVVIGASGCGSNQASAAQQASQGQTNQAQPNRGQMQRNPATQAAMEILRLQRNSNTALTADQSAKIKPILQDLINTADPSQDFLQQKADAISAVFTDQQKQDLTQGNGNHNGGGNNPNGNTNNGSNPKPNANTNPNGNTNANGNNNRRSLQPHDLYKQALDSLK